ncbi:MAG: hypothetical protein QG570_153 [Patescibacteria group bacterium]|nr:hypothetical protein [Patescibacteria group bacterium]MDQ5981406.1 hypothetical protein [Patescibacteria group bacterium]
MKITAVRHGETEENVGRIVQGHLPGRLTDEGKQQATRLADELKNVVFDRIYCSDLQRCRDTAFYIQKESPHLPIDFTPALREISFGSFQGQPASNIDWDAVPGNFYTRKPGGGESMLEFNKRVLDFVNELYNKYPDSDFLFITHGGPMRMLKSAIDDESLEELFQKTIENTALWKFQVKNDLKLVRDQ